MYHRPEQGCEITDNMPSHYSQFEIFTGSERMIVRNGAHWLHQSSINKRDTCSRTSESAVYTINNTKPEAQNS